MVLNDILGTIVKKSGVYRIFQKSTGRCYVGSSQDIDTRLKDHLSRLSKGRHKNIHLQRAWDKYGASDFGWEVIEDGIAFDGLYHREQFYMDVIRPEFNLAVAADAPMRGRKASPETRRKMSEARRRRPPPSIETREKFSRTMRGRKPSEANRIATSAYMSSRVVSDETRQKISEALTGRKGHPASQLQIQKLIERNKRGRQPKVKPC
jgi:group I intron endonuclease